MARQSTGKGQFLDVSITDAITELTSVQTNPYLYKHGTVPGRGETIWSGMYPWHHVYESKDTKHVTIATLEPEFFANPCRLSGCQEFIPISATRDRRARREEFVIQPTRPEIRW